MTNGDSMLKIGNTSMHDTKGGLRAVSLFEAGKGVLVFSLALLLSTFVHRDLPGIVAEFRTRWHLDPSSHIPELEKMLMQDLSGSRLHLLVSSRSLPSMRSCALSRRTDSGSKNGGPSGSPW